MSRPKTSRKCQYSERDGGQRWERRRRTGLQVGGLTRTDAEQHQARDETYGSGKDQPSRAILVKQGPGIDAGEKAHEQVEREDPADGAIIVLGQLVGRDKGLEGGEDVHQAKAGKQGHPRTEDD